VESERALDQAEYELTDAVYRKRSFCTVAIGA